MTRGAIPRFDLYEELEISRLASVEVVEAAYRALVKRHHPDVSRPEDAERIKRLNVAREWLTTPSKRARYDAATAVPGARESTASPTAARPAPKASARTADAPDRPVRASSPASFGVHSREVRQFLAELRALDGPRARELLDGKATLDNAAYAEARSAALAASRTGRTAEWTFAREAASVIARGKLHDPPVASSVAAVVADVAGAIVVRDLLSTRDFELLLAPWTWREEPGIAVGAGAARPTDLASVAAGAVAAVRGRHPLALGASGVVLVALVGIALSGRGPAKPESAVAALTNAPSTGTSSAAPGAVANASPAASMPGPGAWTPTATSSPAVVGPGATLAPGTPPGPVPTPRVTPTPGSSVLPSPLPSPLPSALPTAATTPVPSLFPTPVPTPAPLPTPSPQSCTVVSLVGVNTSNAQLAWSTAGFTGVVIFGTPIPPQYKIGWQSLTAGDAVSCTSDITVQLLAP